MTSSGIVDGGAVEPLFRSPFYATGFPITEAYWSTVRVGGQQRTVLIQIFERRALTFTPGNPAGFTVEAGNVGLQYRAWRAFLAIPPTPTPKPTLPPTTDPPADASSFLDARNRDRHTRYHPPRPYARGLDRRCHLRWRRDE